MRKYASSEFSKWFTNKDIEDKHFLLLPFNFRDCRPDGNILFNITKVEHQCFDSKEVYKVSVEVKQSISWCLREDSGPQSTYKLSNF